MKLYIYGYLNRVRSSRRLGTETHRNLEVIWLMRHLKPSFKAIADFRKINRSAFRNVFRQFVRLCRDRDLFGRELLAVGGTRIKAVNNSGKNFTKASLKRDLALIDKRLGQGAFLTRRLDNVRGGFSMTALAYNIRRAITLVGVPTLVEAVQP